MEEAGDSVPLRWVQLGADSDFVANGLPDLAPAVWQDAGLANLLAASQHILGDLGVEASGVTYTDDTDWAKFPEIGAALKASGGEESPFCVAEYPEQNIWAVGLASQWKKREQAARLALCVAISANLQDFAGIAETQPDFTAFCESVGVSTGTDIPAFRPADKAAAAAPAAKHEKGSVKNEKFSAWPAADKKAKESTSKEKSGGAAGWSAAGSVKPEHRDKPFWITLPETEALPTALDGMPPEAVVLTTQTASGRKGIYGKAEAILDVLLGGDHKTLIEFHDDPQWAVFPTVGKAIKAITSAEECQNVAVCPSINCWAVGVGMKGKARFAAAKVAIAAAIALQKAEVGEDIDYEENPGLAEIVEEAAASRLEA